MDKYLRKSAPPTHQTHDRGNGVKSTENKENHMYSPLSHITRPFSFKEYFSHTPSPSSTQRIKFNNSRAKSQFIMGRTAYKLCPRPTRNSSMLANGAATSTSSVRLTACFICGVDFALSELTAHEKECLENIKTNDTQFTRQSGDDDSENSFPASYNNHNLSSTHSSSSSAGGESSGDKKHSRCYICGTDVPTYLASIHEKNCKKSWETGLLNSICTPARKSQSKGDISSISRSSSRDNMLLKGLSSTDTSLSTPNLTKAKSTTNLRHEPTTPTKNDGNKPRHLRQNQNGRRGSASSKSTSNLTTSATKSSANGRRGSRNSLLLSSSNETLTKSKSTQDIRRSTTPDLLGSGSEATGSATKRRNTADPQYVICQLCGKLYSKHSIGIHQRSCEQTYKKQKSVGTNVEYKIKSRSLVDLNNTNSKRTTLSQANAAANSNSSINKPKHTSSPGARPASAYPINRLEKSSTLSVSTGNLGPSYRRRLLTNQNKKTTNSDVIDGVGDVRVKSPDINGGGDSSKQLSPGLQKCYLCRQLYGTRSLPIHEKQCLKKWERAQAEEQKKKKKKKNSTEKDIQIMTFGRSKFEENDDGLSGENDEFKGNSFGRSHSDETKERTNIDIVINGRGDIDNDEYDTESTIIQKPTNTTESSITPKPIGGPLPSQLFGVSSPLVATKNTESATPSIKKAGKQAEGEQVNANNSGRPRFVVCVYCSKQFGSHSITIHEKSCREKQKLESKTRNRLILNNTNTNNKNSNRKTAGEGKKLSKSVGDISLIEAFAFAGTNSNGGDSASSANELELVRCEECKRKFLKSDINKHKMHCRVSVL